MEESDFYHSLKEFLGFSLVRTLWKSKADSFLTLIQLYNFSIYVHEGRFINDGEFAMSKVYYICKKDEGILATHLWKLYNFQKKEANTRS